VLLLRHVVQCTVTDWPLNTEANFSKCPPSPWIHFLTRVTRKHVTSRKRTAKLLIFLAALRIRWSSSSVVFTLCGPRRRTKCYELYCMGVRINPTVQFQPSTNVRRCTHRMCLIWHRYIPSVCNVFRTLRFEVSTSGLNSRYNSDS